MCKLESIHLQQLNYTALVEGMVPWKYDRKCLAQKELIKHAQKRAVTWMQTAGLLATLCAICSPGHSLVLASNQALLSRDTCVTKPLPTGAVG